MEWINIVVAAICSLFGALGGGSILYFKQNKQLKKLEVTRNQADEWRRLYDEADGERKALGSKLDEMRNERDDLRMEIGKRDLEIQKLRWFHCTVSGCQKRQPPHVFDMNGTEIEQKK